MKYFGFLLLTLISFNAFSQDGLSEFETYPVFENCTASEYAAQEVCFKNTLMQLVVKEFKVPEIVSEENYTGEVIVLFEVTPEGKFKIIYNRQEAINYAIEKLAKIGDIVVVCGKGHEKSMCYGTKEYPWSDQEAVRKALQEVSKVSQVSKVSKTKKEAQ